MRLGAGVSHSQWERLMPSPGYPRHAQEEVMTKPTEQNGPEALATFAATARNNGTRPAGQGLAATPKTSYKSGNLAAEENDAADIIGGNATGDKARVDAAIDHHAQTDKRAG
jgi:hypothetical protein